MWEGWDEIDSGHISWKCGVVCWKQVGIWFLHALKDVSVRACAYSKPPCKLFKGRIAMTTTTSRRKSLISGKSLCLNTRDHFQAIRFHDSNTVIRAWQQWSTKNFPFILSDRMFGLVSKHEAVHPERHANSAIHPAPAGGMVGMMHKHIITRCTARISRCNGTQREVSACLCDLLSRLTINIPSN